MPVLLRRPPGWSGGAPWLSVGASAPVGTRTGRIGSGATTPWAEGMRSTASFVTCASGLDAGASPTRRSPSLTGWAAMPRPYRDGYEPFPYPVRMAALRAAGGVCALCQRDGLPLEVDHHIPQSAGGTSDLTNAVVLCHDCHAIKSEAERRAASTTRTRHTSRYVEPHPNRPGARG
jgi:5-methylcytosine-specific restriction endonuclease McrA